MPPRKRKSVPQPATEPEAKHQQISTLPDLPEAYRVIAEPVHQALSGLLEHLSDQKQPSLESVKDAAQAHLSQFFPTDKEVADSLLQSWVLNISSQSGEDLTPLFRSLDMTLACTQLGFCNETFVVVCLETLLESHSVQKASQLFAWVELRSTALTAGLDPRKAKALTLLRTFNELLRRLSKTNQTVFCGRILMFLAASFPLGDQSSVNLKGAFDTGNVTALHDPDWGQHSKEMDADGDQEQRDKTPEPTEPDFYTVFWSLQRIFAYPPNLLKQESLFPFTPPPAGPSNASAVSVATSSSKSAAGTTATADPNTLDATKLPNLAFLRYATERTFATFKEANKKDKEMAGAASSSSTTASTSKNGKAKASEDAMEVDEEQIDRVKEHYFFPKFLTSRGLLELQVADSHFRRQILIQLLVIFQFLRGHSRPEKEKTSKITKPNRGLIPQVAIADSEMSWVAGANQETHRVIRATAPEGELFDMTVILLLQREQSWINWKLNSCQDFVKPPLDEVSASTEAREKKRRLMAPPRPLMWKMGNPGLTQLWGATGEDPLSLDDLSSPAKPIKDMEYFKTQIRKQEEIQERRKQDLTGDSEPTLRQLAEDSEWSEAEDRKSTLCWRALRILGRDEVAHFSMTKSKGFVKLIEDTERFKAERAELDAKKMKEKAMELGHPEQSSQDKVEADSETNGAAGSGGAVAASHDAEETQKQDADESKAQTLSTEVEMTS